METVVITGATSGFGVNWLYQMDESKQCCFFVLGRDESKFKRLISDKPLKNDVHFIHCRLDSFSSIDSAVKEIQTKAFKVDILVNNAGVWSSDEIAFSQDDIEMTLAVNHLAPFVLTGKLLPLLLKAEKASIVNTASFRHKDASPSTHDIQLMERYSSEKAYCNSKLYSILFTQKLASLLHNTQISVNCFDPGIVDTEMLKKAFPKTLAFIYPLFRKVIARTPEKGAQTGVFLSQPNSKTGNYYKDCQPKKVSKLANSKALSDWLWGESEKLSEFSYPTFTANDRTTKP
ncbi:MAG: SDR family NAD(P)-dependent oxidoreductase [Aliiglaciecola sp.]|uniref:SDR family NAD(P)-dependent oxidoreductase n=1 Tax=Aliiglaciecola sp. TaxID=1872441 RepID=UPI00329953F5